MTDKTELQVEREREGDFGVKKSTRPHSLSRLPRLKLVWIGTCENGQRRSGSAGKGRAKSNAGTCRWLRVAATDVAFVGRPFAEQRSWVNDASTEIHELPRRESPQSGQGRPRGGNARLRRLSGAGGRKRKAAAATSSACEKSAFVV